MPVGRATGIVLAGGRSSRFGSDKLAVKFRGLPLLHHAVLRLAGICDETIVVVAPLAADPILPPEVRARVVRDASEDGGPLVGLVAGLAETTTDLALVAAGDMPEMEPEVLVELLGAASGSSAEAAALVEGGAMIPLPLALRAPRAGEVASSLVLEGERSLRRLLEGLRVARLEEQTWLALDPRRRTLRDVDRPEDLQE